MKARFIRRRDTWTLVAGVIAGVLMVAGCAADMGEKPSAAYVSAAAAAPAAGIGPSGPMAGATEPAGDAAPPIAAAPLAGVPQSTAARPVFALIDHPLFAQHSGLGRVDCTLPEWRDDPESARAFYQRAVGCLDDSWGTTLRSVGLPFRSPRMTAPAKSAAVSSACAQEQLATDEAFYCAADETLIMPFDALRPLTVGSRRGAQLALLSHEYGHHVQALIGVMRAYTDKRTAVGWDTAAGQEQSRRMELQASCFSGMFLGTNYGRGDLDQQTWNEASRNNSGAGDRPGEQRLHGNDQNVLGWFKWGSEKGDTWECNTWYSTVPNVA
ncbi:neutral zinc metallopeptidase [Nocardia sp. GCM10030253]|uniref:neutral zinc metallopeptidase n=1 Tax=Nocardia sp. GCM10030253 TaxID=3273404 RepID=UPI003626100A